MVNVVLPATCLARYSRESLVSKPVIEEGVKNLGGGHIYKSYIAAQILNEMGNVR